MTQILVSLKRWEKKLIYISILGLVLVTIFAKYKYNGLVFGFDYGLYQPDGKYYTYMALDLINQNPNESAQQVVDWYKAKSYKGNIFSISDLLPETSPVYSFVSHRVLYPLLSAPFVFAFGIPGMLVVPALSFLMLITIIYKISLRYNALYLGLIICLILTSSPTVSRWMIVNTTDSLLVGLFSLVAYIFSNLKLITNSTNFYIFILVFLTAATRFSFIFWLSLAIVLFLNRKKILAVAIVFFALICSIPALNATLKISLLPNEKDKSNFEKLLSLPESFFKVLSIDIAQLMVLDRLLLLLLGVGLFLAVITLQNLPSQYFISILLAGYTLGAINGTLGVNFRYQMPLIPFCAWAIISAVSVIKSGSYSVPFLRTHVKTQETQEQL
jgi:hypothetical protein